MVEPRMRVGLTLPTFVEDPDVLVSAAVAAERAGLDGVFTFDHLFGMRSDGSLRPSLSPEAALGAVAAETDVVRLGLLVARANLRPPALLRTLCDTVARMAADRFVAGVGAGDRFSRREDEMFGVGGYTGSARLSALDATVEALHGRGYPVWVGGLSDEVMATAAGLADGWNGWGLSSGAFSLAVEALHRACRAAGRSAAEVPATWGGLVELREDHWDEARERADVLTGPYEALAGALRHRGDAGAQWLVLAPLAPTDPDNAAVVAEEIVPRL